MSEAWPGSLPVVHGLWKTSRIAARPGVFRQAARSFHKMCGVQLYWTMRLKKVFRRFTDAAATTVLLYF